MPLSFYFDVHIPIAIARALRNRGVDVLRAQEDAQDETPDERLLERASTLGRILVSSDKDLLLWAARWQAEGKGFFGLVYLPAALGVGTCVADLELFAHASEPGGVFAALAKARRSPA